MSKAADLANLIGNINAGGGGVNRNVIINGNMSVAQRATSSSSFTADTVDYQVCDRWGVLKSGTNGAFTVSQDSSAPEGFANSLKFDCTTADTSIASGEILQLIQKIEGQNLQHFKKGTSSANPWALSFYVKGNGNATYVAELLDADNSSRHVAKSFSVTSNWTRVEMTLPADTTGTLNDDNTSGIEFSIWLHAGSTFTSGTLQTSWGSFDNSKRVGSGTSSFFSSTDNTFFLTGVQLEVGQNPTEFEHEPFETTLEKCERYYQKSYIHSEVPGGNYGSGTGTQKGINIVQSNYNTVQGQLIYLQQEFRVKMRDAPTIVYYNPYNGNTGKVQHYSSGRSHTVASAFQCENGFRIGATSLDSEGNNNGGDTYSFHFTADDEL